MLSKKQKQLITALQEGIPLSSSPFRDLGEKIGYSESEVLNKLKQWHTHGLLLRITPRLKLTTLHSTHNALTLWQLPDEKVTEAARYLISHPEVSHCYRRLTSPEWPYQLYGMIHAPTPQALETLVETIIQTLNPLSYLVLPTVHEFKKTSPRYFPEGK